MIADSEAIRLPTLRELIGYRMNQGYDDRTTTTLSSVFLHLPRNDVDNDISRGNVNDKIDEIERTNNESRNIGKNLTPSPRNRTEETADDSWLRQASNSKVKSRSSTGQSVDNEETLVTNEDGQKTSSTRIYPTTMRGIPLAELTPSSRAMTRGFYVTRSETVPYAHDVTTVPFNSTKQQQTETTLTTADVSTTNDIITVTDGKNGQHETVHGTKSNVNDNKVINNLERDFSELSLGDSASGENLSDYREIDAVTTLTKSAYKRGKSLRKSHHDTALDRNVHLVSSATRRRIALVVSRYNEATTPLWSGKRIIARKRNRNTSLSPINEIIRRGSESEFRTTPSTWPTTRQPFSTTTTFTTPVVIVESESTVASLNVHRDFINFTDETTKNLETTFPISTLTSTTNDAPTVVTSAIDSTIVRSTPAIMNASISTSSTVAVTEPAVIAVMSSATSAGIETTFKTANYSTTTFAPTAANIEIDSTIANYSVTINNPITVNPYNVAIDSAIGTTSTVVDTRTAAVSVDANATATIPVTRTLSLAITTIATTRDFMDTNVATNTSIITSATLIDPTTTDQTIFIPRITHPTTTHPTTTDPTIIHPTTTDQTIIHPTTTDPTIFIPTTTDPTTTHPTTTHPTTIDPTIFIPTTTDPTTTHPTTTHPTTIDPTIFIPKTTDPTTTHPTTIDPTIFIPTTTDPTTTDPMIFIPTTTHPTTTHPTTIDPTIFIPTTTDPTIFIPTTTHPTTIDTQTTTNANVSFAVTTDSLTTVISTDKTLASLGVPDHVSSTESFTIPSTNLDESTDNIGTTQVTTMFASPTLTSLTTTISQSVSNTDPDTIVTATFPIETNDNLTTWADAQTLPVVSSIVTTIVPTIDTPIYHRSNVTTDTTLTSITSKLNSVQMTSKKPVKVDAGREFKEISSLIGQDEKSRKDKTETDDRNSLQTANTERKLPETRAIFNETVSKSAQSREGNRTSSQLVTNAFGQKASKRRVLNRTNNWMGRPVEQQSVINHYRPQHRVYRQRGRSRRPTDRTSSSRMVQEIRRRRVMRKGLGIDSEAAINRPENISRERVVHDPAKNTTRIIKVVVKRIEEKIVEENTTILPVEETTVLVQSSTCTENETKSQSRHKSGDIGRTRQAVSNVRFRSQSGKDSTIKETIIDTANKSFSDTSQNHFQVGESFIPENNKTRRRRTRVVLKSIRPKFERGNMTEQPSADSDHIDQKNLRNNLSNNIYVNNNLSGKGNARKRIRIVLKSVRSKSEERNLTIEEANANFHSANAQDNSRRSLPTSEENLGAMGKTRKRMRVVLKRVKPKFREGNIHASENVDENLQSTTFSDDREEKNSSLYDDAERRKVVSKSVESKSRRNSTKETNKYLLDEEDAREQKGFISDSVKPKFAEKDSIAEETSNTDLDFVAEQRESRMIVPFNFPLNNSRITEKNVSIHNFSIKFRTDDDLSNVKETRGVGSSYKNERTIKQSEEDFNAEPYTESITRVEENTDRLSFEVNSSKNGGSVSRRNQGLGNGYPNRRRKPTTTIASASNASPNTHRRGTPIEISPKIELVDAFEGTESYAKQTIVENDRKTEMSDQSIRAQEFAVTVADPPSSSSNIGRQTPLTDAIRRKISTTVAPRTNPTTGRAISRYDADLRNRQQSRIKNRPTVNARPTTRPLVIDYDYYEDKIPIVVGKSVFNSKLFLTNKGTIRCLDQGNFPHPYSCKKFITCARMVNGQVIGTEYTCPDKLSFDPVGGICNWSAGLGCKT